MNKTIDPIDFAVLLTTGHAIDVRRAIFECVDLELLDAAASLLEAHDGDERLAGWVAARRAVLSVLVTADRVAAGLEEPVQRRKAPAQPGARVGRRAPQIGHQQRLLALAAPSAG